MLESLGKDALHVNLPKANQYLVGYPPDLLNPTNFTAIYMCKVLRRKNLWLHQKL